MAVTFNSAVGITASSAASSATGSVYDSKDNRRRWDGESAGHYEVWFLTLNHVASQSGFWFRYTLEVPQAESEDRPCRAELWASFFDRAAPERNFGLVRASPIDDCRFGDEDFHLQFGEAALSSSQATGKIETGEHSLSWDLRFTPNPQTYHHMSPKLYAIIRPSSFVCSPNLDLRLSGVIIVDGHEIILEEEPGCQSHLWGSKHVDDWVWVHSNAFEKHEGTVFEGLAARPRRSGRLLPPLQSLFLRHHGEEYRFVRLRFAEQWNHSLGIGYWSFSAMNTRLYLEGTAQCRLKDMLQARYTDPDGEPLYCLNSEVANLKIRVFKRVRAVRWRHCETLNAHATAHLEHAARQKLDGVRLIGT